jgi:hypothetical protein
MKLFSPKASMIKNRFSSAKDHEVQRFSVCLQKYSIKYERKLLMSSNFICEDSSIPLFIYTVLFSRATTLSPGREKH